MKKTNCLENKLFRKHGIFYTVCLTPAAKSRALIGFIAKKYCEEKNLSSEKIRHTSMVNTWKIKKMFENLRKLEKTVETWGSLRKLGETLEKLGNTLTKFQNSLKFSNNSEFL